MRRMLLPVIALVAITPAGCSAEDDGDGEAGTGGPGTSPTAAFTGTPDGVRVTDLDAGPVGVAAVDGAPWVVVPSDGTVRTDAGEASTSRKVAIGGTPLRLVTTPDGVWVSDIERGLLLRIDPATGTVDRRTALGPVGSEPEGLGYDGTSVWVVDQAHNRVLPLDPGTGRWGRPHEVGVGPRLLGTGPGGVWVANFVGGSVSGVGPDGDDREQALDTCLSPQGVAEAAGVVWVTCTTEDRVLGLDADTLEVVATFDGLDGADALVADGETVYAVGQAGPTVWTVDATAREVVARVTLDDAPVTSENVGAAVVGDELAVTHPDASRLYEVPRSLLAP